MSGEMKFLAEKRGGVWEGPLEDLRLYPEGTQLVVILPKREETRKQLRLGLMGEPKEKPKYNQELFNADPDCDHEVRAQPRGGVKCLHCAGWFCY